MAVNGCLSLFFFFFQQDAPATRLAGLRAGRARGKGPAAFDGCRTFLETAYLLLTPRAFALKPLDALIESVEFSGDFVADAENFSAAFSGKVNALPQESPAKTHK